MSPEHIEGEDKRARRTVQAVQEPNLACVVKCTAHATKQIVSRHTRERQNKCRGARERVGEVGPGKGGGWRRA